jgi:serine/threonine protein kinase/WD40 repeat protein
MHSEVIRLRALFDELIQIPASQRSAVLEARCRGDNELRHRLEELIATAEDDSSFLSALTADIPVHTMPQTVEPTRGPAPLLEQAGKLIGRYKLLEKIGEGGFGAVYVAEQKSPIKRHVALKILKLGMDTRAVVARFEAERQALAMMDHPNIAKVFDAGATDTGRPYFAMELVRGIPITAYCDQNNFSPSQRLKLFINICHAIQHAHQKGIIHRDIKPSNILVTLHDGVPVPKVIDFGIAKATQGELTDKTIYTQFQQFMGTPAYMSPEQAEMSGLDIDTRSDIYSLGVLLYELLTGTTPFDARELAKAGMDEVRRRIRETDPARPSNRLRTMPDDTSTTAAKRRGMDARQLISLLRGDLDWIVMRCLEKDRTRRYESASGLAVDIRRHLDNEPVSARPPGRVYRFQKSFQRNRLAYIAATAVAVALLLGIIATTLQSVRASAAQARETIQRNKAEANEQKALAAQAAEAKLRRQAQASELTARQRAYASEMNAAMQAFHGNDFARARDLLNRQRPQPGQKDLRGWEWRYLWGQTRGEALFTLCKQSSEINSLAPSADGNFLAVGIRHKGGITVWNLRTRHEIAHLVPNDTCTYCAFSPAESLLAFASYNAEQNKAILHLWNAATQQMIVKIPLAAQCLGLAFAQNGQTLVTTSTQIEVWRISDLKKLASYPSHGFFIIPGTGFAATRDLTLAAYAYGHAYPQKICVLDLRDGKELWKAVASPEFVTAVAFSPDGKILATADGFTKSDIDLWDAATGKKIGELKGHGWVGSIVFWPDGKKFAAGNSDNTIRVWDVASRKCLDVLRGQRGQVQRVALLPDNKTLVSGATDGTVCFWDTSVTHPLREYTTLPEKVRDWCFAPDSQSILTINPNGEVARWTGADFQRKESLFDVGPCTCFCFSQDGHFLAIGSANGITSIWDVSRRALLRQLKNAPSDEVAFLANGDKLITKSLSPPLFREWDLATGSEIQSWPYPSESSDEHAIGFSPDGQLSVAIGGEGDVIARNLNEEKTLTLPVGVVESYGVAFSPDGKLFAVASTRGARVWQTKTWRSVAKLDRFSLSAAFSPDGRRLATGGADPLAFWDTDSWQNVFTLEGAGQDFFRTAFSPDGNSVGAMNYAGILHVWRAE